MKKGIVFLISCLIPGFGHICSGEKKRGIVFLLISYTGFGLSLWIAWVGWTEKLQWFVIFFSFFSLTVWFYSIIEIANQLFIEK